MRDSSMRYRLWKVDTTCSRFPWSEALGVASAPKPRD